MKSGINLVWNDKYYLDFGHKEDKYYEIGNNIYNKSELSLINNTSKYEKYINSKTLDANKILSDWFPEIDAKVFILHSHADGEKAKIIAGGISDILGISSFVSSVVWNNSDKLLRILDNQFCLNEHKTLYSYLNRNKTTSHVHVMLSIALTRMISNCDLVIFINTSNSIDENYGISDVTKSPWIYLELEISRIFSQRRKFIEASSESVNPYIVYDIDLSHLEPFKGENGSDFLKRIGQILEEKKF